MSPLSPRNTVPISLVQTPSPLGCPPVYIPMAGANPPRNIIDAIVVARYAPLVLPQSLNALLASGYLKQLPKFMSEGDIPAKDHLASFYSSADNYVIVNGDVWMRSFVHSLDGEARKWFRALAPRSIDVIEALDDAFLRHWGDKKISFTILQSLDHLRKNKGNLFLTSQRGLIKCIIRFLLRLNL
jgi:hypothetical protein